MLELDPSVEQSLREILQNIPLDKCYEIAKYHPNYIEPKNSWNNPEDFVFFAAVVDGKVATTYSVSRGMVEFITAFSSNPKIIVLTDDQKNLVNYGWLYNEQTATFTEPDGGAPIPTFLATA